MRCQEEEEEGDHVPGLGTRAGSTLLFSTTARFCDIKQICSLLTSSSIAITSLTIRLSGVCIFNEIHSRVKSYMEVCSETSDRKEFTLAGYCMMASETSDRKEFPLAGYCMMASKTSDRKEFPLAEYCMMASETSQERSQARKRGGVRKRKKWTQSGRWSPKGEGAGGDVPPPALRAEAFENIDLATQRN